MNPLSNKFARLTEPSTKIQDQPVHADLLENKIKQLYGALEGRIFGCLEPRSSDLALKFACAFPLSLLSHFFSPTQNVLLTGLGAAYLWSRGAQLMPQQTRIDLLHTAAIAFFMNVTSSVSHPSTASLMHLPLDITLSVGCLALANHVESKQETRAETSVTVADDVPDEKSQDDLEIDPHLKS